MEQHPDIKYEEEFIINSSGLKLFTCRWLPVNQEAKAIICLCHGYGMECSMQGLLGTRNGCCFLRFILEFLEAALIYCPIADEAKPHLMVITILKKVMGIVPTWKLVPTKDIIDTTFKETAARQELRANPYVYHGRPGLRTAYELLMTSLNLESRLEEVTWPFIILHGKDDTVTDPSASELL